MWPNPTPTHISFTGINWIKPGHLFWLVCRLGDINNNCSLNVLSFVYFTDYLIKKRAQISIYMTRWSVRKMFLLVKRIILGFYKILSLAKNLTSWQVWQHSTPSWQIVLTAIILYRNTSWQLVKPYPQRAPSPQDFWHYGRIRLEKKILENCISLYELEHTNWKKYIVSKYIYLCITLLTKGFLYCEITLLWNALFVVYFLVLFKSAFAIVSLYKKCKMKLIF